MRTAPPSASSLPAFAYVPVSELVPAWIIIVPPGSSAACASASVLNGSDSLPSSDPTCPKSTYTVDKPITRPVIVKLNGFSSSSLFPKLTVPPNVSASELGS